MSDDVEASAKGSQSFVLTINGRKQATAWMRYGDGDSYANVARTEPERMQFLQSLLGSTVSIEFKPFLTGTLTTATFDLSKLGDAISHQAECGGQ